MAARNNSPKTSMKSLLLVLGIVIMVMGSQFNVVECRALRSTSIAGGCDQQLEGAELTVGVTTQFAAASDAANTSRSSSSELVRSLEFKLASGPSKRGPGH
ncbi:hypothetical protein LguiA_006607 [Lonicera macranthoides]